MQSRFGQCELGTSQQGIFFPLAFRVDFTALLIWTFAKPFVKYRVCVGLARIVYIYAVYDRIFGDFPAKNTVYDLYIYGPGQP